MSFMLCLCRYQPKGILNKQLKSIKKFLSDRQSLALKMNNVELRILFLCWNILTQWCAEELVANDGCLDFKWTCQMFLRRDLMPQRNDGDDWWTTDKTENFWSLHHTNTILATFRQNHFLIIIYLTNTYIQCVIRIRIAEQKNIQKSFCIAP